MIETNLCDTFNIFPVGYESGKDMFGGKWMDTFMDKLAQRLNAQEIIKANTAAEAAELSRLKEQNALYEEVLRQVREEGEKGALHIQRLEQGAVRSMQNAERMEEELDRLEQSADKLGRSVLRTEQNTEKFEINAAKVEGSAEQLAQNADKIAQSFAAAEQNAAKLATVVAKAEQGSVRLEQNAAQVEHGAAKLAEIAARTEQGVDRLEQNAAKTEALIENSMAKLAEMQAAGQNTEELNALLAALKEAQAERFDQLAEHMHKESVKVYRNVQAVVVDGNAKQEEASGKNASSVSGKLGAVLGISLVALLVSAAGLAFQVLVYLNII